MERRDALKRAIAAGALGPVVSPAGAIADAIDTTGCTGSIGMPSESA